MSIITISIIIVTVIVSFIALNNERLMDKLIFYPPAVTDNREYYRFVSCGFIHADMFHLIFNMFTFYSFGTVVIEPVFNHLFGVYGGVLYLLFYLSALVVSVVPTYFKNKDNSSYRSLGASGAVSAIVFAGIIINPLMQLSLIIIPIPFPAFIFGFAYLLITYYLDKRGSGNINHSAHLWGALYGIIFIIVIAKLFAGTDLLTNFVIQVKGYIQDKFS
ncbi:MAG: rhomboid family intramembrane serine protease [Ginsengibacter sp.]